MLDKENYVGRLRIIARALAVRSNNVTTQALSDAFGAKTDTVEFLRRVGLLVELAQLARRQVDELEGDPSQDLYIAALDEILDAFRRMDLHGNWNSYAEAFGARTMTLLETCERAIAGRLTIAPPTEDAVKDVLAAVQDAISTVLDADIEPEAQQLLLEILRDVERALLAYHISGVTGLRRAVERSFGALYLNRTIIRETRAKDALQKTWNALASSFTLLRSLDFLRQLPEKIDEALKLFR